MAVPPLLFRLAHLLYRQPEWSDGAVIAAALDVTRSSLSAWLTHLEFHRVLYHTNGRIEADRNRLLSVIASHRVATLRPEPAYPTDLDPSAVHATLQAAGVPHVFSMFTAANEWVFYEPVTEIHVYVERRDLPALRRNVPAIRPSRRHGIRLQPYTESLDAFRIVDRGGLPVTDRFQTVTDLRTHPTGGAHAMFLQEHVLSRERRTQ